MRRGETQKTVLDFAIMGRAAVEEDVWPQPSTIPLVPPDPKLRRVAMSQKMRGGRVVHRDVLENVYRYINEKFGSNEKVPQ